MEINKIISGNSINQIDSNQNKDMNASNNPTAEDTQDQQNNDRFKPKDLKTAVDTANNVLFKNNNHLKFEVYGKFNDTVVQIVDDKTGQVLKEIPPKKIIDMIAKLCEIAGVFVDEKR